MSIGDYSKTTYSNGSPPAINAVNLNKNENKVKEIDTGLSDGSIVALTNNKRFSLALSIVMGI